jgi:arylformamidase
LIIENLINLEKLLGKDFEIIALPLKIDAHGAPARVIAKVK